MQDRSLAEAVTRKRLTYLAQSKFASLYDCIDAVHDSGAPGDFMEFGVALGGSGICLASALGPDRRFLGFDVFAMIPPPTEVDGINVNKRYAAIKDGNSVGIGGDKYYGYVDDLYNVVRNNFSSFGLEVDGSRILLVKGHFNDTLPAYDDAVIALAHIDCDWYEPVLYCLEYAWPRLSQGGFIVVDDYNDWHGCRKATDEFLLSHPSAEVTRKLPHAVIRKPVLVGD